MVPNRKRSTRSVGEEVWKIKYVIYQASLPSTRVLEGYYQGTDYVHQGEKFGCFDNDVSNAKLYKNKKIAETAIRRLGYFANAHTDCLVVKELEE